MCAVGIQLQICQINDLCVLPMKEDHMPQFQEIVLFLKESYPFNANQGNLVLK